MKILIVRSLLVTAVAIAGGGGALALAPTHSPSVSGSVAIATSPSALPSPVVISPSPLANPSTVPVATAAPAAPTAPTAPAPQPPAPSVAPSPPPPAPSPVPVPHSVTWSDPTPGISPVVGGAINGPSAIGTGLLSARVTGTVTCTEYPTASNGFTVGIRDTTTGQQVWNGVSFPASVSDPSHYGPWPATGNAQVSFPSLSTVGDIYIIVVQFWGTTVMCDWSLTLTA